jgi:hypothetical protein
MRILELLAIERLCADELEMGRVTPSLPLLSMAESAGIGSPFIENLEALKAEARRQLDLRLREMPSAALAHDIPLKGGSNG